MPTSAELADGIGRVKLIPGSGKVTFIPEDLPMDPGTGRVIFDDVLKADNDVASSLGYTKVELHAGTYTVNYGMGDPFGRIEIPATLVP